MKLPVSEFFDKFIRNPGNVKLHYDFLKEAGYVPVHMNRYVGVDLHVWVERNLGRHNYNWTGSVFWFNNEQDATIFALKWA